MSEENVVPESTPEVEAVEAPVESVVEESQPQEQQTDVKSESSTEEQSVVDAVLNELNEDEEPENIPDEVPEPEEEKDVEEPKKEEAEATDDNPKDELYDEPDGLKPKAQERFRSLVEANKAKDRELEESRSTVSEIQKTIQNTGISPQEFSGLLDFARMATSQSPDEKRQAFNIAKSEMQKARKRNRG